MRNYVLPAAVFFLGMLSIRFIQADEADNLAKKLKPLYQPPAEFANDFGPYKSPMIFDDGTKVKSPEDWRERRQEILGFWNKTLGEWPAVAEKPKIEYLEKERRENVTQHHVKIEVAPGKLTDDAYLLVPDGDGPFPAVVVVFYEAKTGIGRGKNQMLDFAWKLAKRGFVTLSVGSDPFTYYPSKDDVRIQPLSYHALESAHCYQILANLPFVDVRLIGIVGHSYGGKWTMFSSCLNEKFACAVWSDPGIVFDDKVGNINYWEPWYLGYEKGKTRNRGLPTEDNPVFGPYKMLRETGHDLHELHVLMAPRPFLVSGGSEDPVKRRVPLNHSIAVNRLLGYEDRVAMTNRPMHTPTAESNEALYNFFEYWLKHKKVLNK